MNRIVDPICRYFKYVKKTKDCWFWRGGVAGNGYGHFSFRHVHIPAHRQSWIIHNGPIPKGKWVLHKCDVRVCVNPGHLFIGTRLDNIKDCVSKKRHCLGEKHPHHIATEKIVKEIRRLYIPWNVTRKMLAKRFHLKYGTVASIINRTNWKHI